MTEGLILHKSHKLKYINLIIKFSNIEILMYYIYFIIELPQIGG